MKSWTKRLAVAAAALALCAGAAPVRKLPDGSYALVAEKSRVQARVAYFGVSHKDVVFPDIVGEFQYRATGLPSFDLMVTAEAGKLDAGSDSDNGMLKGEDFFNTAKFPLVTYHGTKLTFTGAKTATVDGQLEVRGVRRPLPLKVTFAEPLADMIRAGRLEFAATTKFKRSAFGMKAYPVVVGDRVSLTINARFDRK